LNSSEKHYNSHASISIEILKTTSVVVVRQKGYEECWKCWLNQIWWFGRVNTKPSMTGQEHVADTQKHEVYRATWRRDRFQPTTDNISRYFKCRTTATKTGRIWINGIHHQAYCIC